MSLLKFESLTDAVKILPLLAAVGCGGPSDADLNKVRTGIRGMTLAQAMPNLKGQFERSCEALGQETIGDSDSQRTNMDAIVAVRDQVGAPLLSDATQWTCPEYVNDCFMAGDDCNPVDTGAAQITTRWNIAAGTEDLLTVLKVEDAKGKKKALSDEYAAAAAGAQSDAARFAAECGNEKKMRDKDLSGISQTRDTHLAEKDFGLVPGTKWLCTPTSSEMVVKAPVEIQAKAGTHGKK